MFLMGMWPKPSLDSNSPSNGNCASENCTFNCAHNSILRCISSCEYLVWRFTYNPTTDRKCNRAHCRHANESIPLLNKTTASLFMIFSISSSYAMPQDVYKHPKVRETLFVITFLSNPIY